MKYRNKRFAKIGYKNSYTQSVFYDMANDKRKKTVEETTQGKRKL